jgi:biofilm protein TabA
MILDQLSLWRRYSDLAPGFDLAFAFLERSLAALEPGRHAISGDDIYASVSDSRTRPHADLKFETHEAFIDIQVLTRGRETILWTPRDALQVAEPYLPEKDVAFYRTPAVSTPLNLAPGLMAVFFPEDAHAPGGVFAGASGTAAGEAVRKVVVKVRRRA